MHVKYLITYVYIRCKDYLCVLSGLWLKWCFIACYIDDANYSIPALQTFSSKSNWEND